ncbi:MAG TPA: nucleotide disphospho-sugar-binding domain-containing protein [Urbifossiella sp.]|nr:nucleotide disphospho-sugar-binding domain-containing protein [Urbifossiella sp.]
MRILLAPLGSHGDVHPFLGLGHALKARGHDVHVITFTAFRDLVERNGFAFAPVGAEGDFERCILNSDLWHPRRSIKALFGDSALLARQIRDGYERLVERYTPGKTVIAAGMLALWARIANEKPGIPMASIQLQPAVIPSNDDPPEFAQLRMRPWWPGWFKSLLYWYGDCQIVDPLVKPAVNEFRSSLGLPPSRRIIGQWVHSPQRIIGLFPEWFGNAADWPEQMRLAGFVRFDQAGAVPMAPELDAFLNAGDKPIAFSFGSAMRHGKPYFEAAVEACRILGKRGLILARGKDQVPEKLPDSVLHVDYAPFSEVFPRCAAVVHHGGIGTCAQGLAAGVPQLIMPLSFDQPDNARRLERLGVGARLWPRRFTGKNVAAELFRLLDSPATIMRARDVAELMREGDPATRACQWIEELARAPASPASQ